VDGLKGFAAASPWLVYIILRLTGLPLEHSEPFRIVAGVCAVLGHSFTCWLHFKGGKGIATTGGVYFALAPVAAVIALGAWVVVLVLSRYVSVASIAAAVALPTAVWLTKDNLALGIVTTALGVLAIYRHRTNIQRLIAGEEHRVGGKKPASSTEAIL
jgi:glycerol-3-phosphate acyltransferase PlsY